MAPGGAGERLFAINQGYMDGFFPRSTAPKTAAKLAAAGSTAEAEHDVLHRRRCHKARGSTQQ